MNGVVIDPKNFVPPDSPPSRRVAWRSNDREDAETNRKYPFIVDGKTQVLQRVPAGFAHGARESIRQHRLYDEAAAPRRRAGHSVFRL
jgi:hypothetical protein